MASLGGDCLTEWPTASYGDFQRLVNKQKNKMKTGTALTRKWRRGSHARSCRCTRVANLWLKIDTDMSYRWLSTKIVRHVSTNRHRGCHDD